MEKSAVFNSRLLPYLLLTPQLIITFVFFYWPASRAFWQSFLREDAFGLSSETSPMRGLRQGLGALLDIAETPLG